MAEKLVRDKIPHIIKADNQVPVTRIANSEEYLSLLKQKLQEEVSEFLESEEHVELADILEVMHALCASKDISMEDIEVLRQEKFAKRGGFSSRIVLERIDDT